MYIKVVLTRNEDAYLVIDDGFNTEEDKKNAVIADPRDYPIGSDLLERLGFEIASHDRAIVPARRWAEFQVLLHMIRVERPTILLIGGDRSTPVPPEQDPVHRKVSKLVAELDEGLPFPWLGTWKVSWRTDHSAAFIPREIDPYELAFDLGERAAWRVWKAEAQFLAGYFKVADNRK